MTTNVGINIFTCQNGSIKYESRSTLDQTINFLVKIISIFYVYKKFYTLTVSSPVSQNKRRFNNILTNTYTVKKK